MNEPLVAEYVELSALRVSLDPESEYQHTLRLDQLWYEEMSLDDRSEAEKRLFALSERSREARYQALFPRG